MPPTLRHAGHRLLAFMRGFASQRRLLPAAVVAVSMAGTFWFVRTHWFSLYDDAYTFMRYAANIIDGCGVRWNCSDPPVEGFSSPMFLGLSVLFRMMAPDAETASQVLGWMLVGASIAAAGLLVPRMLRAESPAITWAATLGITTMMAFDHVLALNAVIGMDSSLGMLTGVMVLHAALSKKQRWLRLALCFAILVRFEFVLLVAALPLFRQGRNLNYYLPVLLFLAVLTLARWLMFHDVLPNTFWVKSGGTRVHIELGLRYAYATFAEAPFALAAPLALLLRRPDRRSVEFFLAGALVWTAFIIRTGGDHYPHGRLLMPLIPALAAMGAVAVVELTASLGTRLRLSLPRAGAIGVLLVTAAGGGLDYARRMDAVSGYEQIERWAEVGKWIARFRPGASIATAPIGAIGFHARQSRVIDILGLTSPEVAHAGRTLPPDRMDATSIGHERHNTEWVLAQKPDLFVTTHARREQPFRDMQGVGATVWAEWQLMLAILKQREPYRLLNVRLSDGRYWLMFERNPGS